MNLFRPRVLAAGAWFLLLSAVPFAAATIYRGWSWSKIAQNLYLFYSISYVLSAPLMWIFNTEYLPPSVRDHPDSWIWAIAIGASVVLVGAIRYLQRAYPTLGAVMGAAFVLSLVASSMRGIRQFQMNSLALWFFGVFLVTVVIFKLTSMWDPRAGAGPAWSWPLGAVFISLLLFARYYYPHLEASWGGGAPVAVTIYFTKDAPISPNKAISAQLVDESDAGFYIVGPNEAKAIFVPRNAVALVYFSDTAADSPLLRGAR